MTACERGWLFLAAAAWGGAAAGRLSGAGPPELLALAGTLAGLLACRRAGQTALLLSAAGLLFAGLSSLEAAVPRASPAPSVRGRLTDIAPAVGGVVLSVRTARGARERVFVPQTGDRRLDAPPAGFEIGAAIETRVKQGPHGAAMRRGLSYSAIDISSPATVWHRVLTAPARLRRAFQRRAADRLAGDGDAVGAFLVAAVSGDDRRLDRDVWEALRVSGLAHIAVVSGFNVALLALLIGRGLGVVTGRLHPARHGLVFAAVLASTLILPLDPPVQRASSALLAAGAGRLVHRGASPASALAAAVTILLLLDPSLAMSLSFGLTVAATAAIILASQTPGWWGRAWVFAGPTIATWPILVEATNRVSPWALAANLAALPAAPAAIGAAWLTALLPRDWGAALTLTSLTARAGARWILAVADAVAQWPASGALAGPGGSVWVTLVLALFVSVVRLRGVRPRAAGVAVLAGVASWPLLPPVTLRPGAELVVLDVGQGQATLMCSRGSSILADSGDDRARAGTRAALGQLRALGIRRVDLLVFSHPDRDHAGGALLALAAIRPRVVALPAVSFAAPAFEPLRREAARRGAPVIAVAAGDIWERGAVVLRVLHPAWGPASSTNDDSVVLRAAAGDLVALIPGDAGAEVERRLETRGALGGVDVLVAGHHGARTCTSDVLLAKTRPAVVLVSAGKGNRYGHPHPETLGRLVRAGLRPLTTATWGPLRAHTLNGRLLIVEAGDLGVVAARRRGVRVSSR